MSSINTLIKWPGGKSREIQYIEHLIPQYDRYIEPFFGGGAMFFYLKPCHAVINDISHDLIDFYTLVKEQNPDFKKYLDAYCILFTEIIRLCHDCYDELLGIYNDYKIRAENMAQHSLRTVIENIYCQLPPSTVAELLIDKAAYQKTLYVNAQDKIRRTIKNEQKAPFNPGDLKENVITGFTSGTYMYFRDVYNDILLKRLSGLSKAYRTANFYFIREYCYGSMFRYNRKGEFNIPYGGMSYNKKNFKAKIQDIFNADTKEEFANTDIYCTDFADLFIHLDLKENDFMFLDPPYDTDFSDYEGKNFTQNDQRRLAAALKKTKAKFILIIKNTAFILSLYEHDFNVLCFDKTYTYNVRSRNERNVEHLIITNLPVNEPEKNKLCR